MANYSDLSNRRSTAAQVIGVIIGPIVFGADLLLSYSLVQHSCSTGHFYVLHLITVVCVAIVLGGAWMSWRQYQLAREGNDEGGSVLDRSHFLALLGVLASLFFVLVILANAVPKWILSPCD